MTTTNDDDAPYMLHAILPAMHLRDPVGCAGVIFCTTDHLDQYAVDPAAIRAAVQQLARQYCDDHSNVLGRLGLELIPNSSADALIRQGVARMCRDAVALCFIMRGASLNCHHEQVLSVANSDFFDTLPIRLRDQGFIIQRPGMLGTSNSLDYYHPALPTHLGTPRDSGFQLDDYLMCAFDRAIAKYMAGRQRQALRQVFRATALAMHATRILPETEST
ncbi:MAG: hypothetical protein KF841_15285 [Phycisphaerae bacterium]|nr:hypothetical protein [Phycisphaerae bacterium]